MLLWAGLARAAETVVVLEGEAPEGGLDHFFLPFEVPEGIVEVEIRHDDLSEENILDWGLDDPAGFRCWGGGNPEPAVVGERAASRSCLAGPVAAGEWRVVVGKAKIAAPPAVYRVEVVLRDAATLADQPERRPYADAAPLSGEARWYAGDLHVHSRESGDATPTLGEIAAAARARGLDFVALSDHNTVSQLDWIGAAQDAQPELLFVPSVEYTTYQGHANGIGATAWVDHRLGQPDGAGGSTDGTVDIAGAAEAFAAQGAFFSVNHPSLDLGDLCIGCAWDHALDPALIQGIELITGGWEPVGQLFYAETVARWEAWEAAGARLVPVGGSDDHRAGAGTGATDSPIGSPTTMVYAEELSVPAILEGLRLGRTVVKLQGPDDPMLELWPSADGTGDWEITVTGGEGTELRLIGDGSDAGSVTVDGDPFRWQGRIAGGRVRADLWAGGAPRTATAYQDAQEIPIRAEEACGCRDGKALLLLLPLGGLRRRARRRDGAVHASIRIDG